MTERPWFSSKVRLVVITGAEGGLHYADSVFVFRAVKRQGELTPKRQNF